MEASSRLSPSQQETENSKLTKSPRKPRGPKPGLPPIAEETDSPGSSASSVKNLQDLGSVSRTKKCLYEGRVSSRNDYAEILDGLDEEEGRSRRNEMLEEGRPFILTAENASDHDDEGRYRDSSGIGYGRNGDSEPEDEEEGEPEEEESEDEEKEEDDSLAGESTSGDVDYCYDEDYDDNDLEAVENDDLDENPADGPDETVGPLLASSRNKMNRDERPKSAPSCTFIAGCAGTDPDERFGEMSIALNWLKARVVKSERDIFELKKRLNAERIRGRKIARRCEEDKNVARESLRIDLELWIKKLNDGLKVYLADWQRRERLRLNEEVSRMSDLYSQEIAKSLRISLKEWQTEAAKSVFEVIERREKLLESNDRANAKIVYEKIHTHLENLEKRNKKSYSTLCKQIDKWEERLKSEVVKIHEEDLKNLREQVNSWCEQRKNNDDYSSPNRRKSKDQCFEMKRSSSFLGAEALQQVEDNLLKRLRDSSTKDLRRTEMIVRTELKSQRRELAKRMNDKIGELWSAFEEFGAGQMPSKNSPGHGRSRTSIEEFRDGGAGNSLKDAMSKPEVSAGGRRACGKINRSNRPKRSSSSSDLEEDADRDFAEDEDETTGESSERNNHDRSTVQSAISPDPRNKHEKVFHESFD